MNVKTQKMESLQNEINTATQVLKENLQLIEKRYDTSQELLTAVEILNNRSEQFSLLNKDPKSRLTWKFNTRPNPFLILLIFIVAILLIIILCRN